MSRELKITLSDEQCDALAAEAKYAGLRFFDHCRAKLLNDMAIPLLPMPNETLHRAYAAQINRPYPLPKLGDAARDADESRLDRLETMMTRMAEIVQGLAEGGQSTTHESAEPVDVDDVISGALDAAEHVAVQERTQPDPQFETGVRHVGTRPPAPFSGRNVPNHLRNAFGP